MTPADWPKARGARSNPKPRFDRLERDSCDDGWDLDEDSPAPPGTTIHIDKAKSVITRNTSPDIPFDRSINPYRGCAHGCVYCFARPSHAYLDLSPGLDFETQLFIKPDAPRLLEAELRKPGYRPAPIAIGTNTDPYQPIEREHRIMRGCLEVLAAFNHPVTITTKSHLVTRDIDILAPMAAKGLAAVAVSVTTLDRDLHRKLEPRAATPAKRLEAIRQLAAAGIPTMVMAAPVIPRINDHELEAILAAAKEAGAQNAAYTLLRLPYEVKDLFAEWLQAHFPDRAEHVLSLVAQQRDGKLYSSTFGTRYSGAGPHAELLAQRVRIAQKKLGLDGSRLPLDVSQFKPPPAVGDQMSLF
ncbi:MAG TPA: PA0069 family radical SAM protein [Patescibacteria group bacterium]|nr:PA0069 family radical SAM protein [Patescibacteria group bacterium]